MSELRLPRRTFEKWVAARKMTPQEFADLADVTQEPVRFTSLEVVKKVADRLRLPIDRFVGESDLDHGVNVCRGLEGYQRTEERDGKKYCTYTHLANSRTAPNLMSLHLTLHCNDTQNVVLDSAHDTREFVYILRGNVKMHWDTGGPRRDTLLNEGDSVYLQPGVSHCFMAQTPDAEILAVNF